MEQRDGEGKTWFSASKRWIVSQPSFLLRDARESCAARLHPQGCKPLPSEGSTAAREEHRSFIIHQQNKGIYCRVLSPHPSLSLAMKTVGLCCPSTTCFRVVHAISLTPCPLPSRGTHRRRGRRA